MRTVKLHDRIELKKQRGQIVISTQNSAQTTKVTTTFATNKATKPSMRLILNKR